MNFRDVATNEYELVRNWPTSAEKLGRRATLIASYLGKMFGTEAFGGVPGLLFVPCEKPFPTVLCDVNSPAGNGRLRLEYALVAEELVARVVVERAQLDEQSQPIHRPVWAFHVPERGLGFVEPSGGGSTFVFDAGAGHALENSIIALGLSISFALVAGPLVKPTI